jgi:hypothetical protein
VTTILTLEPNGTVKVGALSDSASHSKSNDPGAAGLSVVDGVEFIGAIVDVFVSSLGLAVVVGNCRAGVDVFDELFV